jgi:hypothetical protein
MNTNTKAVLAAAIATLGLAAGTVQAADTITVRNSSFELIHPYFKSNCWVDGFNGGNDGPNVWVFFGGIGGGNQFTWSDFSTLLDPNCKHPVIRFVGVRDGDPAPTSGHERHTATINYDATKDFTIRLGYPIVILDDSHD